MQQGLGEHSAVLAKLPELNQLDRQCLTTLVGLAPLNGESGTMRGKRMVWGGRARERRARLEPHR